MCCALGRRRGGRPAPARWPRESGGVPGCGLPGRPLALPRGRAAGPRPGRAFFSRGGGPGWRRRVPRVPDRPGGGAGGERPPGTGLAGDCGLSGRSLRWPSPASEFSLESCVISSLVSASPERGRVKVTGARAALDLGAEGRGPTAGTPRGPGRGRLAWGRWGL